MRRLRKKPKKSQRLRYPIDEAKYVWLPMLLDSYHIADVGISVDLDREEKNEIPE